MSAEETPQTKTGTGTQQDDKQITADALSNAARAAAALISEYEILQPFF